MLYSGYLILRTPEENPSDWPYSDIVKPPNAFGQIYAGVDRLPWFDLEQGSESGLFQDNGLVTQVLQELSHFRPIQILEDFSVAQDLQRLLMESNGKTEINYIQVSEFGNESRDDGLLPSHMTLTGYDIVTYGLSYLRYGIFLKSKDFPSDARDMLSGGLLRNTECVSRYLELYKNLQTKSNLEPLFSTIQTVRVFRN